MKGNKKKNANKIKMKDTLKRLKIRCWWQLVFMRQGRRRGSRRYGGFGRK